MPNWFASEAGAMGVDILRFENRGDRDAFVNRAPGHRRALPASAAGKRWTDWRCHPEYGGAEKIYLIEQDAAHLFGTYVTHAVVQASDHEVAVRLLTEECRSYAGDADDGPADALVIHRQSLTVTCIGQLFRRDTSKVLCVQTGTDDDEPRSESDADDRPPQDEDDLIDGDPCPRCGQGELQARADGEASVLKCNRCDFRTSAAEDDDVVGDDDPAPPDEEE